MRLSRRKLLEGVGASSLAFTGGCAQQPQESTFINIVREPDEITVLQGLDRRERLSKTASAWSAPGMRVKISGDRELQIALSVAGTIPTHVHLRWNTRVARNLTAMGDAWERSYGDLHWSSFVPQRPMPWYFFTWDGYALHGYGVKTGAAALCFWQLDPDGVSLWLDVSNGGSGVILGDRELLAATVLSHQGEPGVDPATSARRFCSAMCPQPRKLPRVLYGSNDWYYAYGKNTAAQILRDAELVASLVPPANERGFTVIDDGWENGAYGDMAFLANEIRQRGVRPGLWIRPLQAPTQAKNLLLPSIRSQDTSLPAYDPTNPSAMHPILEKVRQAVAWGYELIKHDYTTYELFGQWGFEMGAQPAQPGWSFYDRSRTNAEIVGGLYADIRHAAGEHTLILGCNTIAHLGAGIFEAQRIGDDVNGKVWERTRRMGVNTLAYRFAQNRSFHLADPDCVPITTEVPWELTKQWLDLVARSGMPLFVSPQPQAIENEQIRALGEAFAHAGEASEARPVDWLANTTPEQWEFRTASGARSLGTYDWIEPRSGAWPFAV